MINKLTIPALKESRDYVQHTRLWFAITVLQGILLGVFMQMLWHNVSLGYGIFLLMAMIGMWILYRKRFGIKKLNKLYVDENTIVFTDPEEKTILRLYTNDIQYLAYTHSNVNPMAGSIKGIINALKGKPDLDILKIKHGNNEQSIYLLPKSEMERVKIKQWVAHIENQFSSIKYTV
jgi:hypothetical protein